MIRHVPYCLFVFFYQMQFTDNYALRRLCQTCNRYNILQAITLDQSNHMCLVLYFYSTVYVFLTQDIFAATGETQSQRLPCFHTPCICGIGTLW